MTKRLLRTWENKKISEVSIEEILDAIDITKRPLNIIWVMEKYREDGSCSEASIYYEMNHEDPEYQGWQSDSVKLFRLKLEVKDQTDLLPFTHPISFEEFKAEVKEKVVKYRGLAGSQGFSFENPKRKDSGNIYYTAELVQLRNQVVESVGIIIEYCFNDEIKESSWCISHLPINKSRHHYLDSTLERTLQLAFPEKGNARRL